MMEARHVTPLSQSRITPGRTRTGRREGWFQVQVGSRGVKEIGLNSTFQPYRPAVRSATLVR